LKADIWGEIFERFMTLQNLYKMFSDPPGILRKKFIASSYKSFEWKF